MIIVLLAMMAGGCGEEGEKKDQNGGETISRSPNTPIVIPAGEPIVVGVSAALTGPIGPRGLAIRDAVVVGVERWKAQNGHQIDNHLIEVYAEDDGCYERGCTGQAANRLFRQKGLVGVIGPECSSGAIEGIPIYADAGIVVISASATRSDLTINQPEPRFFFRTVYTNAAEGIMQARYVISQLNAAKVCVIDDSEPYGNDLADAAQTALEESGVDVARKHIMAGAVDFSDIAAAVASDNPDAVIFEGYNPEGALLYRQLRDAGYEGAFVSGDAVASVPNFVVPLGEQSEGAVFAGITPDLPEEFVTDCIEILGSQPATPFVAHVVDAVYILLDAVVEVAEQEGDSLVIDPLELREAVSNPKLLVGLSGVIAFDDNGDRVGNAGTIGLNMGEVRNSEIVPLTW
ncbi:branched-chain amino acid ABC transporter substrate-binding protein [Chloroflexota bacterium]